MDVHTQYHNAFSLLVMYDQINSTLDTLHCKECPYQCPFTFSNVNNHDSHKDKKC